MSFNDDDLRRLKGNLAYYGVYPGIDVCNYFDNASEIAKLVLRLEAAENVCFGIMLAHPKNETCECSLCDLLRDWRKAAGK